LKGYLGYIALENNPYKCLNQVNQVFEHALWVVLLFKAIIQRGKGSNKNKIKLKDREKEKNLGWKL